MKASRAVVLGVVVVGLAALVAAPGLYREWHRQRHRMRPVPEASVSVRPLTIGGTPPMPAVAIRPTIDEVEVSEVARGLEIVWAIEAASDGRVFVTERPGRIRVLKPGSDRPIQYARLPTALRNESGLMGLALHPDFPREPWVYIMYTARKEGGGVNRISRIRDRGDSAGDEEILLDDIPAAANHDGGALEFGPDGMLYIGTGDAGNPALAQDLGQPNGKILRIRPDGGVPADNPIAGTSIWAYGFRNVSGLAFHPVTGELWAASHGPSSKAPGEPKHMDSIYRVRKGRNHGWPSHLGVSADPDVVAPTVFFTDRPVPPGGLAFYAGAHAPLQHNLFMTSLGAQELHRYVIGGSQDIVSIERWWTDRFGRLRAITTTRDGTIYLGTSNGDGKARGEFAGSDVIYRIKPIGERTDAAEP